MVLGRPWNTVKHHERSVSSGDLFPKKNRAKAGAISFISATWQGLWPCPQRHDHGLYWYSTALVAEFVQLPSRSLREGLAFGKLRWLCMMSIDVHDVGKLACRLLSYTKQKPISCLQFESRNIPLMATMTFYRNISDTFCNYPHNWKSSWVKCYWFATRDLAKNMLCYIEWKVYIQCQCATSFCLPNVSRTKKWKCCRRTFISVQGKS
jgi:hypothetical protein